MDYGWRPFQKAEEVPIFCAFARRNYWNDWNRDAANRRDASVLVVTANSGRWLCPVVHCRRSGSDKKKIFTNF